MANFNINAKVAKAAQNKINYIFKDAANVQGHITQNIQSNNNGNFENYETNFTPNIENQPLSQMVSQESATIQKYVNILNDYDLQSYHTIEDGTILIGTKDGENSKVYLLNNDDSLNGVITLDSSEIINVEYNENTITIQTANGTQNYDVNRIKRSIELAQKYEGINEGNYYETDGAKVVDVANKELGKDYVYGASGPDAYDCSGFVGYCLTGKYERIGTTTTFMNWPQTQDPQPGDICVNAGHTGIYIGDGQMIHAATEGVGVIIGPVQAGMIFVTYPGD